MLRMVTTHMMMMPTLYAREEGGQYNQYADSDPLDILAYSEACSIELYGSACPDPFGIKKGYDSTLRRATRNDILPTVVTESRQCRLHQ